MLPPVNIGWGCGSRIGFARRFWIRRLQLSNTCCEMLFTRNASVRMKLLDFDYPTSYTKTRAFRVFLFNFRKFSAGAVLVEGLVGPASRAGLFYVPRSDGRILVPLGSRDLLFWR